MTDQEFNELTIKLKFAGAYLMDLQMQHKKQTGQRFTPKNGLADLEKVLAARLIERDFKDILCEVFYA